MNQLTKKKHLIIIGFMGTGKTTVGEMVSKQIQIPCIDLDAQIESRMKMSIQDIFDQKGEDYFREIESKELYFALNEAQATVIVTGGGIVLRRKHMKWMQESGFVVQLTASPEVIIRRLLYDQTRPLLQGDLTQRVQTLFRERQGLYDFADAFINTERQTIQQIANKIIQLWQGIPD